MLRRLLGRLLVALLGLPLRGGAKKAPPLRPVVLGLAVNYGWEHVRVFVVSLRDVAGYAGDVHACDAGGLVRLRCGRYGDDARGPVRAATLNGLYVDDDLFGAVAYGADDFRAMAALGLHAAPRPLPAASQKTEHIQLLHVLRKSVGPNK